MTAREIREFQNIVLDYYHAHGRHDLPWRNIPTSCSHTTQVYRILVSEVMLQQTQVSRVIEKYRAFIRTFPTVHTLAVASLADVLTLWQGLGYNRRARMLHECAQTVVHEYRGRFPSDERSLTALPGIGPYTASAIVAFANNMPTYMIETNIRSVYLHHFFSDTTNVPDSEVLKYIEATCDTAHPREWYWALMDYGSYIKRTYGNPNRKSRHHAVQTRFAGSDRQIRGAILRELITNTLTLKQIKDALTYADPERVNTQVANLTSEGLIEKYRYYYRLPQ